MCKKRVAAFWLLLVFICICPFLSLSQERTYYDMDSITRLEFDRVVNLGGYYFFTHPDSTLYYGQACLRIAINNNYPDGKIVAYILIGYAQWLMSDYPASIEYMKKARELCESGHSKYKNDWLMQIYDGLGCAFCSSQFYSQGFESLTKAKNLSIQINSKPDLINELSTLGDFYEKINQNDSALHYLYNALNLAFQIHNTYFLPSVYKSIGNAYKNLNRLDSAIHYWRRAIDASSHDFISAGEAHDNLGKTYMQLDFPDSVHLHIFKAIEFFRQAKNLNGLYESNNIMTTFFKKYNKKDSFYHYLELSSAFKDSLFNDEKRKQLNTYSLNEQIRDEETRTAEMSMEIKRQTLIRNYTLGTAILSGIFSFLLIRSFNRRRKTVFDKQVSEVEMKALRSQMNPHFIFNSLHSINKYMMDNDKENAGEYLSKFSKLMRLILENSREQQVPLEDDLSALEMYMQLESLRFQNGFKYEIEVDPQIDKENTLIPPMLLQPFVENSIIHGIRTNENGMIHIKIEKEDNMIRCSVEDNGIGRGQTVFVEQGEENKHGSLGMKITKERLQIINELKKVKASLNIFDLKDKDNKPAGLRIELILPLEMAF